jgi:hypothetical protein
MSRLRDDLLNDGFERTERESPFHDDGTLWRNSYELVCDETGIVIRGGEHTHLSEIIERMWEGTPRYSNSGRVILPGGMIQAYDYY